MKNLDDIDKGELLQLCGEMNAFVDGYAQNRAWLPGPTVDKALRMNRRFAELTGDFPDSDCNSEARP
jgi:hypothetical protein